MALVYELWNEYAEAINTGDLVRWMSLWTDDGIQMVPDVPTRVGKEKIREAMQPEFNLFVTRNLIIHIEEVHITGDWAYTHGTYAFNMKPTKGGENTICWGKFLDILVKLADGSWKIAIDCHNYNPPSARDGGSTSQNDLSENK